MVLEPKKKIKELYKAIGAPEVPIWAIGVHGVAANFGVKEWSMWELKYGHLTTKWGCYETSDGIITNSP